MKGYWGELIIVSLVIVIACLFQMNFEKYRDECQIKGGVAIRGYYSADLCLSSNAVIKFDRK